MIQMNETLLKFLAPLKEFTPKLLSITTQENSPATKEFHRLLNQQPPIYPLGSIHRTCEDYITTFSEPDETVNLTFVFYISPTAVNIGLELPLEEYKQIDWKSINQTLGYIVVPLDYVKDE